MRLFVLFQLLYVPLRVSPHLPPVQLLTAHLTSLLPLNQHLKSFSILLGPKKGKLAHRFDAWQRQFLIQSFSVGSQESFRHFPQNLPLFSFMWFSLCSQERQ